MPTDADFDKVRIGSGDENECTPSILDDWDFRGIRIAAPKRVALEGKPDRLGNFARMVVCGAYQLDSNYLGLQEQFMPRLLVVAVNLREHRAYAGKVQAILNAEPSPNPFEGQDIDLSHRFVTEFFNPNLVAVLGLPQDEAEYVVYAALGRYVSNVVRISLTR